MDKIELTNHDPIIRADHAPQPVVTVKIDGQTVGYLLREPWLQVGRPQWRVSFQMEAWLNGIIGEKKDWRSRTFSLAAWYHMLDNSTLVEAWRKEQRND